jgi:Fur family transcriptional regulator, ferric uptake regulator
MWFERGSDPVAADERRDFRVTVPHASPPLAVRDMDAAVEALRSKGLRVSAARRLVLEALFTAGRPVPAEDIADGLAGRVSRSDLASTYRNLETLEAVGLVRHFHVGHGPGLYGVVGAGEREYLACDSCGGVQAVRPNQMERLRSLIRDEFGYETSFSHFPLVGLCPSCAGDEAKEDSR